MNRRRCRQSALLALAFALAGCAVGETLPVYKLYPGPVLTEPELATVRAGSSVTAVRVDGLAWSRADYDRVQILPGEHSLSWDGEFWTPVVNRVRDRFTRTATVTMELAGGEAYILHAGHPESEALMRKLWIEVESSGDIIYERDIYDP